MSRFISNSIPSMISSIALLLSTYIVLTCLPVPAYGAETFTFALEEAIEHALKNNKGIALVKEKVKEAEAGQIIAKARFFPSLSASASYTRLAEAPGMEFGMPTFGEVEGIVLNETGIPTGDKVKMPGVTGYDTTTISLGSENVYLLRASLQYPIFTWWKTTNAYKISSLNLDAAREGLRRKENEIRFSVTESFLRLQLAKKGLELTNESLEQLKQHVKQAEALYDAGRISRFDFLRARVQLSGVKVQVTQAKNGLVLAGDGLKNLLGIGFEDKIVARGTFEYMPYEIFLPEAVSAALKNRSEIKDMDLRVKMAQRGLDIAKAGDKPNVVLTGNYDYKNPAGSGKEEWGTDWSATLAVSVPIYQGGEIGGKIKQAESQLEQVKLGKEQIEEGIRLEVRSTFLQLNSSRDLLVSQEENTKEAREALEIAETRYLNGLITNLEYLDAQVAFSRAETGYVRTLSDYLIAIAQMEKAMGK